MKIKLIIRIEPMQNERNPTINEVYKYFEDFCGDGQAEHELPGDVHVIMETSDIVETSE